MSHRMKAGIILLVAATVCVPASAQRLVRGFRVGGGRGVYNGWYGGGGYYGGYGGYGWGGTTAYGNATRANAALIQARGQASVSAAKASKENEEARSKYLDNRAKYEKLRREQREYTDARKAKELAERKQRAAERPAPKITNRYDRLPVEELDTETGSITWPESLQRPMYAENREIIERALLSQAEDGPSERTSRVVFDTADKMKTMVSSQMKEMGFEQYSRARQFLGSLSVEGYHAMEDSQ
jgi:hypothetical protein